MTPDSPSYCHDCGEFGVDAELHCFDGADVDPIRVDAIVRECIALERQVAERGEYPPRRLHELRRVLAGISDRRAVPALINGARCDSPQVRQACMKSLGFTEDPGGIGVLAEALSDVDDDVYRAAAVGLARIGGAAIEVLRSHLPDRTPDVPVSFALAWCKDPAAIDGLLAAAVQDNGDMWPNPVIALQELGDRRVLPRLCAHLTDLVDQAIAHGAHQNPGHWRVRPIVTLLAVLRDFGGAQATAAVDTAVDRLAPSLPHLREWFASAPHPAPVRREAPQTTRRVIPRWSLHLTEALSPIKGFVTKFGGQPVWLGPPSWPVTRVGTPMTFFAQFRVPWADDVQMAYLFIDASVDAENWDPEAGGNALVVQPGLPPQHLFVENRTTGPRYDPGLVVVRPTYRGSIVKRFTEHVPTLAPGLDPVDWDGVKEEENADWMKVGGTPRFLQGEEWPAGAGWRFLFQFSADRIGHELGDGAECYGFVSDDGQGRFLWQCH